MLNLFQDDLEAHEVYISELQDINYKTSKRKADVPFHQLQCASRAVAYQTILVWIARRQLDKAVEVTAQIHSIPSESRAAGENQAADINTEHNS